MIVIVLVLIGIFVSTSWFRNGGERCSNLTACFISFAAEYQ